MTNRIRSTAACLFFVSLVAFTSPINSKGSAQPAQHRASLTFAERVAYQYAIEEIYWRHRIWPWENPSPKPALDEVVSRAQIEKKVEDYLRDSQTLEDYWQRPITQDQLQAEMDRMARNTKQPDVLRELFAALNHDPFVIAECLARPIVAERLVARSAVVAGVSPASNFFAANTIAFTAKNGAAYVLSQISVPLDCADDTWAATTLASAPTGRYDHTAIWTGTEMIVWGGLISTAPGYANTGGRYNPSTDSWVATSTTNAPAGRERHTAVWTGTEMIVWGGGGSGGNFLNNGGRYNPITDSWIATSNTNAPTARRTHTAVWTGSEMIVWGGSPTISTYLNTGGRYNPSTDSWVATSTTNAPAARRYHTAVWTGSEMIVWGGYFQDVNNYYWNTGGRYDPISDSWTATTTTHAPDGRAIHTAIWTGSQMIIWGGTFYDGNIEALNTGGIYTPGTDSWTATSITTVPGGRYRHSAVLTGSQMIIWGGTLDDITYLNTGGRYNIGTDSWSAISGNNSPSVREAHTAVWTGSQMVIWGGYSGIDEGTGGRYCAQPSTPIVQSAVSRKTHSGAGSFDVNLPLSGTPGLECRSGGATNDYTMVVTFLANVSVNGSPQAAVTAGSGTIGSNGMSNGGIVIISGDVVTIPLTNVVNAQTINVTLNSVNGSTNVTIPMSVLIGDTNANGTVNAADVAQTKSRLGQTVGATNFRSDVNANGMLNAADAAIVKQNSGTSLPPD
jgi:N-acetylneuraminic acid mutarotase